MVNNMIPTMTTVASALTTLNLTRMKGRGSSGYGGGGRHEIQTKRKEPSEFLKQKFNEAWNRQEKRLSKLKTKKIESKTWSQSTYDHYRTGEYVWCYENGQIALCGSYDEPHDSHSERYDELGNCIENDLDRCVYYPNSKQKEFEWNKDGIKHFDENGVEDTKVYTTKQKVAAKRIAYENQTGETLPKMSKVEKAVAIALKDTKKMTLVERMLAEKAKKTKGK